ncbi:olfactory receptor 10C1-like [Carettochelys insculpta]|uniref:olfactory receptor 10C1-like n=1 Tax=Carettochelys insculpta TaxID=44489 RepID=UPI003EB7DE1C
MEKPDGRNQMLIMEFILLGFGDAGELQPLLILLFLVIYIVTLVGNVLIVVLVIADQQLHMPMYYLLGNLSFLEICYTSTFQPRLLVSLLTGYRTISVKGCIVQLYFFGTLSSAECLLLTAMSYDRYLAICHPLRYGALMNGRVCCQLVAGSWVSSSLSCTVAIIFFLQSTFCGTKEIDYFFCDFSPLIKVTCSDTRTLQQVIFIISTIGALLPFLLILMSYICIIITILRIPSVIGRKKAFSTCSSHLIVLAFFYGTVITVYMFPTANTPKIVRKIFSVFYTVLTTMINPVIYSLRNKEVKNSLRRAVLKLVALKNRHRI